LALVVTCGLIAAAASAVCAQDIQAEGDPPRQGFVIDWWTLDGGGGPSAAGAFELLATVGQSDVGDAIGEDYILQGGFLAGGDLGVLFADGFESGGTGRWDGSTVGTGS
jgi:hypothetical protein